MTVPLALGIGEGLFTGTIFKVVADVSGKLIPNEEEQAAAARTAMAGRRPHRLAAERAHYDNV